MGLAMAGHIQARGFDVAVFDVSDERMALARERGMPTGDYLQDMADDGGLFILAVATDAQVEEVCETLAGAAKTGTVIVVAATVRPETVRDLAGRLAGRGLRLVDAPVVYGATGAREGTLLSLCGGAEDDIDAVRPVLMSYSRDVVRVGPVGAGQVAKACNNLLHWIHCVGNFETLLIAKRYGLDGQRMREVLLDCPGTNGTLRRWDTTRFTWQEKDMDITMDMAQQLGLMLPLAGQVDQLVKTLSAADVKALLYGDEVNYLGRSVRPLQPAEGGLG
ncbi:3-hydroxyisobutyrate dehydrogenase [Hartmannibacter diazotrophicus]|uniref:3-hydroxyisobutyrate dehydrogenase n=2 Tax=Hartmannibacter diazotrophicus TaxID=1482074 RepID=A0A2C9DBU7_9HYPH|nr:3-hydroxyisobutyrate dehydrogenase [Hartmannibacter diazotrophicus]